MLQFASSHTCTSAKTEKQHELVQLNSQPIGLESNSARPVTVNDEADAHNVEWIVAQPPHHGPTTRSLSAIKRKEQHEGALISGGDVSAMDEILRALKKENESLSNLHVHVHAHEKPQLTTGDRSSETKRRTSGVVDNQESLRSLPSGEQNEVQIESTSSPVECPPRIKGPLLPTLPFRPVLVNRYKPSISAKPSTRKGSASEVTPVLGEGAIGVQQQSQPSVELRGSEVASQSLTEHTVKIITDKVRRMDAR